MTQNNPAYGTYQPPYNPYMSSSLNQGESALNQGIQSLRMPNNSTNGPNGNPSMQQSPFVNQQTPSFQPPPMPTGPIGPIGPSTPGIPGPAQSQKVYMENILRMNRGKLINIYMTFENNSEWNAKIFSGIIEEAGRDHILLRDPTTETHYLLPMVNFDYATFEENIEVRNQAW